MDHDFDGPFNFNIELIITKQVSALLLLMKTKENLIQLRNKIYHMI